MIRPWHMSKNSLQMVVLLSFIWRTLCSRVFGVIPPSNRLSSGLPVASVNYNSPPQQFNTWGNRRFWAWNRLPCNWNSPAFGSTVPAIMPPHKFTWNFQPMTWRNNHHYVPGAVLEDHVTTVSFWECCRKAGHNLYAPKNTCNPQPLHLAIS